MFLRNHLDMTIFVEKSAEVADIALVMSYMYSISGKTSKK